MIAAVAPWRTISKLALLALAATPQAVVRAAEDEAPVPYVYAYRLGSGIYTVEGRTVQLYRIPVGYRIPGREERRWGIELRSSATIGFFDFRLSDVADTGVPQQLGAASLVPGVSFPVQLGKRWTLTPAVEGGVAWESSTDSHAYLYALELGALGVYPARRGSWRLGQELAGVGQLAEDPDPNDRFVELQLGVEYRHPLGVALWGHEIDWGLFVQWHGLRFETAPAVSVTRTLADRVGARGRWELGVTFGSVDRFRVLRIPVPRLGLAVEHGNDFDAVRLVFGSPF